MSATTAVGVRAGVSGKYEAARVKAPAADAPNPGCSVCAHPELATINQAITAGTSASAVAIRILGSRTRKDSIARHARKCLGRVDIAGGRRTRDAARKRLGRAVQAASAGLKPVESAEDVVADLQRLRVEAFGLFEEAKARADWKSAERIFGQVVAVVDRFGEMHRVLGPKGTTTITVDRSTKVMNVLGGMHEDELRNLLAKAEAGDTIALPALEPETYDDAS